MHRRTMHLGHDHMLGGCAAHAMALEPRCLTPPQSYSTLG